MQKKFITYCPEVYNETEIFQVFSTEQEAKDFCNKMMFLGYPDIRYSDISIYDKSEFNIKDLDKYKTTVIAHWNKDINREIHILRTCTIDEIKQMRTSLEFNYKSRYMKFILLHDNQNESYDDYYQRAKKFANELFKQLKETVHLCKNCNHERAILTKDKSNKYYIVRCDYCGNTSDKHLNRQEAVLDWNCNNALVF